MNISPAEIQVALAAIFGAAVATAVFAVIINFVTGVLDAIKDPSQKFTLARLGDWVTSKHGLIAIVTVMFLSWIGGGDPAANLLASAGASAVTASAGASTYENLKSILGLKVSETAIGTSIPVGITPVADEDGPILGTGVVDLEDEVPADGDDTSTEEIAA